MYFPEDNRQVLHTDISEYLCNGHNGDELVVLLEEGLYK
jgi:hypothetical protein